MVRLAAILTVFISVSAAAQCPPNAPNQRAIVDYTVTHGCDISKCQAKLICEVNGPCIKIPATCAQCDPHPSATACLTNKEVHDAEKGNKP